MSSRRTVPTPHGDAVLHIDRAPRPIGTLVLGHGAGGGSQARDLAVLADALPRQRVSVLRVDQPWRVAGRKVAPPPKILDECWTAVLSTLRQRSPLIVGGRSAGARVACRTGRRLGAVGVLAIAFPLVPPGRPEHSRVGELLDAGVPTLVMQGERDSFGRPDQFPEHVDLAVIPGADHGMRVLKRGPLSQEEALAVVVEAAVEWVTRLVS